jgi:hypothetical protein
MCWKNEGTRIGENEKIMQRKAERGKIVTKERKKKMWTELRKELNTEEGGTECI